MGAPSLNLFRSFAIFAKMTLLRLKASEVGLIFEAFSKMRKFSFLKKVKNGDTL